MKEVDANLIRKTESETLLTFQEEIPSQYFSHMSKSEYSEYVRRAEHIYRDYFKFPPKMFEGADLIDFGAGTGENTVYLANWGAKCTLVEMNVLAQNISREVFAKYAKQPNDHTFHNSSIFEFELEENKLFDIVHCRGVLSHTAAKEKAFAKIAAFLKPGGFLIFGDPNKAGGFQNMLQRYAVYTFGKTPDEMVDVSELLFKEDIDRSERTIPRTRRAIIFDRWVIQCQDDPSVAEVISWASNAGLSLYTSFPPVERPFRGDSLHHHPPMSGMSFPEFFSLSELCWMMQTISDQEFLTPIANELSDLVSGVSNLAAYVANMNASSIIDLNRFEDLSNNLKRSVEKLDPYQTVREKLAVFANEAVGFVKVVQEGDLMSVRRYIEGTEVLFRGACGNRHVDFITYRPYAD